MQELIVFIVAGIAGLYLVIRFLVKRKTHQCDKCGLSDENKSK